VKESGFSGSFSEEAEERLSDFQLESADLNRALQLEMRCAKHAVEGVVKQAEAPALSAAALPTACVVESSRLQGGEDGSDKAVGNPTASASVCVKGTSTDSLASCEVQVTSERASPLSGGNRAASLWKSQASRDV